jgi:hypothetical protein
MKKKIIMLGMLIALGVSAAFANGDTVSKDAVTAFTERFSNATDVQWQKANDYDRVSFKINGQMLSAIMSEQGQLIAVTRNILPTVLPLKLQGLLYKNFKGYWVTGLTEYALANDTRYFINIENADKKLTLESVSSIDWSEFEKITKG